VRYVPDTITEALNSSGINVVFLNAHTTATNVRPIPYSERYREANALMKTPAERFQELNDPAEARDDR
jgi:hypothetical protein